METTWFSNSVRRLHSQRLIMSPSDLPGPGHFLMNPSASPSLKTVQGQPRTPIYSGQAKENLDPDLKWRQNGRRPDASMDHLPPSICARALRVSSCNTPFFVRRRSQDVIVLRAVSYAEDAELHPKASSIVSGLLVPQYHELESNATLVAHDRSSSS